MPTLDPRSAYPALAVGRAERHLTEGTDRYMDAAAAALDHAAVDELRASRGSLAGARVLVLAGGGHNGADALLAGARLARRGCRVSARLATEHPLERALGRARRAGVRLLEEPPGRVDLVIDGLTGIGATGPLRPAAAALIAPFLALGAPGERAFRVLAVDVPSGTDVDSGTVVGPVLAADRTVTFTCLKGAHLLPPAARLCGRVDVVDLGLPVPPGPPLAVRPADDVLARLLRVPGDTDHKYTRGVLGVWAGSIAYPGAAVLTTSAAVRAGAGMVRLQAPERAVDLVLARRPEVVPADGRCQALLIGPGTDPHDAPRARELREALRRALDEDLPAVIDAGALPLVARAVEDGARLTPRQVLTPHAGEAASLLSALCPGAAPDADGTSGTPTSRAEVDADPAASARALARLTGATVLLKGTPTLVASPDAPPGADLLSLDSGPGWLATAGSGDVLAGVLGAVLASAQAELEAAEPRADEGAEQGIPEEGADRAVARTIAECAALAVRIHATAGHLASGTEVDGAGESAAGRPLAALDLTERVPEAIEILRGTAGRL